MSVFPPSQNYEIQKFRKVTLSVFLMLYRIVSALLDSLDLLTFARTRSAGANLLKGMLKEEHNKNATEVEKCFTGH